MCISTIIFILIVCISSLHAVDVDDVRLNLGLERGAIAHYDLSTPVLVSAGTKVTLVCRTVNAKNEYIADNSLKWRKITFDEYSATTGNEVEKIEQKVRRFHQMSSDGRSIITFTPVTVEDRGTFVCYSDRYNITSHFQLDVRAHQDLVEDGLESRGRYKCLIDGHLIPVRYKCDGRPDCIDGSDEERELCNGDPCAGKLWCDDRCIPENWCCNRFVNADCHVTNRPSCCPPLPDPYDPLLYKGTKQNNRTILSMFVLALLFTIITLTVFIYFLIVKYRRQKSKDLQTIHRYLAAIDCDHTSCRMHRYFVPNATLCFYRPTLECADVDVASIEEEINRNLLAAATFNTGAMHADSPPAYNDVVAPSSANAANCSRSPPPYEEVVR